MLTLRRRHPTGIDARPMSRTESRPVLLATLEAPLVAEAARLGVDSAVESGQPLLVVNAVETMLAPCGLTLGYDYITPPDVEESLRAPAALAHSLGVRVERFCIRSTRPVDALISFASERGAGLLVLGPDPTPHLGPAIPACSTKSTRRCTVPRVAGARLTGLVQGTLPCYLPVVLYATPLSRRQ